MAEYTKSPSAVPGRIKQKPITAIAAHASNPERVWIGHQNATVVEFDLSTRAPIAIHKHLDWQGFAKPKPDDWDDARTIRCLVDRGDGTLAYATDNGVALVTPGAGAPTLLPAARAVSGQIPERMIRPKKLLSIGEAIYAQGVIVGSGFQSRYVGVNVWPTPKSPPELFTTPQGFVVRDIVHDAAAGRIYGIVADAPLAPGTAERNNRTGREEPRLDKARLGVWQVTDGKPIWALPTNEGIPLQELLALKEPLAITLAANRDQGGGERSEFVSLSLSGGKLALIRSVLGGAPRAAVIDPVTLQAESVCLLDEFSENPESEVWTTILPHDNFAIQVRADGAGMATSDGDIPIAMQLVNLKTGKAAPLPQEVHQRDMQDALAVSYRASVRPFAWADGYIIPVDKALILQPSAFHPVRGSTLLNDIRKVREVAANPELAKPRAAGVVLEL